MRSHHLTVVISAGQSRNPEKRALENAIAEGAAALPGVHVLRIPHLYDLAKDGDTFQALRAIESDMVAISWLFDRATHWILDRNNVRGQVGEVELKAEDDEAEEASEANDADSESAEDRVTDSFPRPNRMIYCLDFRVSNDAQEFVDEVTRIAHLHAAPAAEVATAGTPLTVEMLARVENPTNDTYVGNVPAGDSGVEIGTDGAISAEGQLFGASSVATIEEHPQRRWYPVIDFSRCTNCMECIDFCLFGVYGVDTAETILVDQPDNCRKGCPACSRVCPQNAIIFPQHKTPAIAGAPADAGGLKIDLSKLFGAPDSDEDAADVAARERDEQLILAGRQPVGTTSGLTERLAESSASGAQPDELDSLLDELDSLDL